MSQIVHITFEKLTGLKGEIEGWFRCDPETIDPAIPLVFIEDVFDYHSPTMSFYQVEDEPVYLYPTKFDEYFNYREHFRYGTNFLIKSWSYGGGVTINSQPPN